MKNLLLAVPLLILCLARAAEDLPSSLERGEPETAAIACTATSLALVMNPGSVSPDDWVAPYSPKFEVNGKGGAEVWNDLTAASGGMA